MKLSVGYNPSDRKRMLATCLTYADSIGEIYFSWPGMASGRSPQSGDSETLLADLDALRAAGIGAHLLLNANCYGARSMQESFYRDIGGLVGFLSERTALKGITTTSPMIAAHLKRSFPALAVRASINMNLRGSSAMEYVSDVFDEFYLTREYNRDLAKIEKARAFCDKHGKKLYLLANSGCLNDCPAHVFHDNLVAHEHEIDPDDFRPFDATCWRYLSDSANRCNLLRSSSWIRPEELHLLDDYFDGAKLATRASANAFRIVAAYAKGEWNGNTLALTEPSHAVLFQPYYLDNACFPKGFLSTLLHCGKRCENCSYCEETLKRVLKNTETGVSPTC